MQITITNHKTGETIDLARDVCTTHPQWVHDQLGTSSEAELQLCLDQYNVSDWYDKDGKHLGPDTAGISMHEEPNRLRISISDFSGGPWVLILDESGVLTVLDAPAIDFDDVIADPIDRSLSDEQIESEIYRRWSGGEYDSREGAKEEGSGTVVTVEEAQ